MDEVWFGLSCGEKVDSKSQPNVVVRKVKRSRLVLLLVIDVRCHGVAEAGGERVCEWGLGVGG